MATLLFDHPAVGDFVRHRLDLPARGAHHTMGVQRDGRIVAGVIYEDYTGHNLFMHVAADPGFWLSRAALHAFFAYPFVQLACQRVTGWLEASNAAAIALDEHLGFVHEATLKNAARDGGDVLLYVLRREDCRFLGDAYARHVA